MMQTRIVKVPQTGASLGQFKPGETHQRLEQWQIQPNADITALKEAGDYLRQNDTPVAFPTETVYGLGADATRSASVKGIYAAKGRPSDNPLIVHVCDLQMLRELLGDAAEDMPDRYKTLMDKFWPGPLTLLVPNPQPSKLAPEVTAGLSTFGVRMPSSTLALSLIKLAGVPLAAPSANASTKPSPTAAHHVKHDLDGRIELILDGGPSQVGVESTVVDGICEPPVILRPGGVSIEELRSCAGWENVVKGYKDESEEGKSTPRAPGMKYKHYSPKARVVLYESSNKLASSGIASSDLESALPTQNGHTNGSTQQIIGIIRTQRWKSGAGFQVQQWQQATSVGDDDSGAGYEVTSGELAESDGHGSELIYDIDLGHDTRGIAQGLFSALRDLDSRGADTIFVD
ncbi:hypothetical protein Golomagni_05817, partial [Golovinomyces magnicellulatus]